MGELDLPLVPQMPSSGFLVAEQENSINYGYMKQMFSFSSNKISELLQVSVNQDRSYSISKNIVLFAILECL